MAGDTDNPRVWEGADVYFAPVGTTAPTDVTTAWAAAWIAAGLLGEDGLTETRDEDSTDLYAYGGILVRTTRSKHKRTFTVTLLEDHADLWELLNPGSTAATTTGVTTRTVKVPTSNPMAFGIEFRDGTTTKRIVVPKGQIVISGDVSYSDSELAGREATITVYPASDGTLYVEITNDPQAAVV